MIDLSPQPADETPGTANAAPLHDRLPLEENKTSRSWWRLTPSRAEAGIQRLSRWAGPAVLIVTVCVLGWWIIY